MMRYSSDEIGCLGAGCAALLVNAALFVGAVAVIAYAVKWVLAR